MKKLILSLSILLGVVGLSSCEPDIIGDGIIERETRRVSYFNKIELPINADIILTQGPAKDIEIEAESNVMDALYSTINGNTLRFNYNGNWVRTKAPVKIWIQIPDIQSIRVSGSGRVISDNLISSTNLVLSMSGSGLIDVAANIRNDLDVNLSGSGKVFIEGDARNAYYEVSGSGKIQSFDMHVDNTDIEVLGTGRCETTTFNSLAAYISGSGEVWFRGFPKVKTNIVGVGRVVDAN